MEQNNNEASKDTHEDLLSFKNHPQKKAIWKRFIPLVAFAAMLLGLLLFALFCFPNQAVNGVDDAHPGEMESVSENSIADGGSDPEGVDPEEYGDYTEYNPYKYETVFYGDTLIERYGPSYEREDVAVSEMFSYLVKHMGEFVSLPEGSTVSVSKRGNHLYYVDAESGGSLSSFIMEIEYAHFADSSDLYEGIYYVKIAQSVKGGSVDYYAISLLPGKEKTNNTAEEKRYAIEVKAAEYEEIADHVLVINETSHTALNNEEIAKAHYERLKTRYGLREDGGLNLEIEGIEGPITVETFVEMLEQ